METKTKQEYELEAMEVLAKSYVSHHRGQTTEALYVPGNAVPVTNERAYAAILEEQPEAYAAFRKHHNAKALVATLEAAGVRLER